jgi:NAD/NADP transhydrogenase alpha subunit
MGSIQNCCFQPTKTIQEAYHQTEDFLDKNPSTKKLQGHLVQAQKTFDKACDQAGAYLDKNPTMYKIAIFATHIFRSIAVLGMIETNPFSPLVSLTMLVSSSLLYRAAVERFCTFRFTLPSLAGGAAMYVTKQAIVSLAAKSAFTSIGALFSIGFGLCSLAGYLIFVSSLSHFDVERRMQNMAKSCCV